jgi:hypothetical protein
MINGSVPIDQAVWGHSLSQSVALLTQCGRYQTGIWNVRGNRLLPEHPLLHAVDALTVTPRSPLIRSSPQGGGGLSTVLGLPLQWVLRRSLDSPALSDGEPVDPPPLHPSAAAIADHYTGESHPEDEFPSTDPSTLVAIR